MVFEPVVVGAELGEGADVGGAAVVPGGEVVGVVVRGVVAAAGKVHVVSRIRIQRLMVSGS
ncbi:MAG: hypothetical protein ACLGH7_01590, partial [Actinomycetes bacterium]